MKQIKLLKNLGENKAGDVIDVTVGRANYLVRIGAGMAITEDCGCLPPTAKAVAEKLESKEIETKEVEIKEAEKVEEPKKATTKTTKKTTKKD